jgi:hypothetical protein
MPSGDPRKQKHDAVPSGDVIAALPPSLSAVVTEVGATVVPFPGFAGQKAIDLQIWSGPLQLHLHFPPQVAEVVIDAIRQAKMKADTGLEVAGTDALAALKNGNGAKH